MCMSWRQPTENIASAATHSSPRKPADPSPRIPKFRKLGLNFVNSKRFQTVEKHFGLVQIEILVARLHHQEKTVVRSPRELRHVENRMIRSRQSIQRKHSKHSAEGRAQHRQLERNRNEMWPAVVRFAAHVQWVTQHVRVPLHSKAGQPPQQAARKHEGRKNRSIKANRLIQTMNRHWRIRVNLPVAGLVGALRRLQQLLGRLEFRKQSVKWFQLHGYPRISGL